MLHPALVGLLRDLPKPGPWDRERKRQFIDAFTKVFEVIYPDDISADLAQPSKTDSPSLRK